MSNLPQYNDRLAWSTLGDALVDFHDQFVAVHDGDKKRIQETIERTTRIVGARDTRGGKSRIIKDELRVISGEARKNPFFDQKFAGLTDYARFATASGRRVSIALESAGSEDSIHCDEDILAMARETRRDIFRVVHREFFASEGALLGDLDQLTKEELRAKARQIGVKSWQNAIAIVKTHGTLTQLPDEVAELSHGLPKVGATVNDRFNILNKLVILSAAAPSPQRLEITFPMRSDANEPTEAN